MQNQILGFFILTSVALGVLCAVQWNHVQEQRALVSMQTQEISDLSIKLDGQAHTVDGFHRAKMLLDVARFYSGHESPVRWAIGRAVLDCPANLVN